MKTHGQSFLLLLTCISLPSLTILIEGKAIAEAPQSKDDVETSAKLSADAHLSNQLFGSFRMAEELVHRLSSENLKNRIDAQRVADDSLRTILPELLAEDKEHAQQLGFEKNAPRQDITLQPNVFPIFEVGLNQLRSFVPNTNAKNLLKYTNQLLLPIGRNKQVQSSVTVRFIAGGSNGIDQQKKNDGWRPTRWGRPHLIRRLAKEQEKIKTQGFLVSISSLNRNFFGYEDNGAIKLIPLANDYLFEAGEHYSAHDVFKQLAQEAESMDGSPR